MADKKEKDIVAFVSEELTFPEYGITFKTTPDDPKCHKQLSDFLKGKNNG